MPYLLFFDIHGFRQRCFAKNVIINKCQFNLLTHSSDVLKRILNLKVSYVATVVHYNIIHALSSIKKTFSIPDDMSNVSELLERITVDSVYFCKNALNMNNSISQQDIIAQLKILRLSLTHHVYDSIMEAYAAAFGMTIEKLLTIPIERSTDSKLSWSNGKSTKGIVSSHFSTPGPDLILDSIRSFGQLHAFSERISTCLYLVFPHHVVNELGAIRIGQEPQKAIYQLFLFCTKDGFQHLEVDSYEQSRSQVQIGDVPHLYSINVPDCPSIPVYVRPNKQLSTNKCDKVAVTVVRNNNLKVSLSEMPQNELRIEFSIPYYPCQQSLFSRLVNIDLTTTPSNKLIEMKSVPQNIEHPSPCDFYSGPRYGYITSNLSTKTEFDDRTRHLVIPANFQTQIKASDHFVNLQAAPFDQYKNHMFTAAYARYRYLQARLGGDHANGQSIVEEAGMYIWYAGDLPHQYKKSKSKQNLTPAYDMMKRKELQYAFQQQEAIMRELMRLDPVLPLLRNTLGDIYANILESHVAPTNGPDQIMAIPPDVFLTKLQDRKATIEPNPSFKQGTRGTPIFPKHGFYPPQGEYEQFTTHFYTVDRMLGISTVPQFSITTYRDYIYFIIAGTDWLYLYTNEHNFYQVQYGDLDLANYHPLATFPPEFQLQCGIEHFGYVWVFGATGYICFDMDNILSCKHVKYPLDIESVAVHPERPDHFWFNGKVKAKIDGMKLKEMEWVDDEVGIMVNHSLVKLTSDKARKVVKLELTASRPRIEIIAPECQSYTPLDTSTSYSLQSLNDCLTEAFPVLVAFEDGKSIRLVTLQTLNEETIVRPYLPTNTRRIMLDAVKATFYQLLSMMNLFAIEQMVSDYQLPITLFVLTDTHDSVNTRLADKTFGTRFVYTNAPGVWAGINVVKEHARIVLLIRTTKHQQILKKVAELANITLDDVKEGRKQCTIEKIMHFIAAYMTAIELHSMDSEQCALTACFGPLLKQI